MGSGTARTASGAFTGTGAANTIVVGFRPRYIHLMNASDPDQAIHWKLMPDASCIQSDAGTVTFETTNGITITVTGFTLAAANVCNVSTEQIYWFATEE